MSRSAIVIGAGVVGMATAYALARRGMAVTLVERHAGPGLGTSFANGAQFSYSYTDALASPGLLKRLPAILAGADPAFRVSRRADPEFLRWSLAFLRNCTDARFTRNTLAGLELAARSRLALAELLARHPLDFAHDRPGKLLLFEDSNALRRAVLLAERKVEAGADLQVVTGQGITEVEPALSGTLSRLAGAIWAPGDEVGDPFRFCAALLPLLVEHYGVTARMGEKVERIEAGTDPAVRLATGERIAAGHIVICAGPEAAPMLRTIGLRVPIMPVRGHSFTAPPGPNAPRVSITDTARKLVFCRLGGSMRIAGQADVGVRGTAVDAARLRALVENARASLPHAADYDRPASSWAGLRPVTPDSLPVIARRGPVTVNVGHGALGWTYACGSAEEAAGLILG